MRICENCGTKVPKGWKLGTTSEGMKVCCVHYVYAPLGCRCKYGEMDVPEVIEKVLERQAAARGKP